jgi:hypothetical protein
MGGSVSRSETEATGLVEDTNCVSAFNCCSSISYDADDEAAFRSQ